MGEADQLVALVRSAQSGDALAMAGWLDALAPLVGRWCAPIALADGPDAAQEALIAVFRSLRDLRDPKAVHGWVRAISIREALRVARRAARERPSELPDLPSPGDPTLVADVRDLLDRLSPEHRAVLVLRELEGLDERTIADVLNLPAGTVKSRLSRARDSFRKGWQG